MESSPPGIRACFALEAESLEEAGVAVTDLVELAESRGFRLELGNTTSVLPVDD